MEKIDELKTSIAGLGQSISTELDAISKKLSTNGTSDADIDGAIASIAALKKTVDDETAILAAAPTDPGTGTSI